MARDRDVRWKRGKRSRARQLAGDALAGVFVGVVIITGVMVLWGPQLSGVWR